MGNSIANNNLYKSGHPDQPRGKHPFTPGYFIFISFKAIVVGFPFLIFPNYLLLLVYRQSIDLVYLLVTHISELWLISGNRPLILSLLGREAEHLLVSVIHFMIVSI